MDRRSLVLLGALLMLLAMTTASSTMTDGECEGRGFQRVDCRHCELLLTHTGSTELDEECRGCCRVSTDAEEPRYIAARLEWRGFAWGSTTAGVKEFLRMSKDRPYAKVLEVRDATQALWPRLVLVDDHGEELVVPISGWEAHKVDEFLVKRLHVS